RGRCIHFPERSGGGGGPPRFPPGGRPPPPPPPKPPPPPPPPPHPSQENPPPPPPPPRRRPRPPPRACRAARARRAGAPPRPAELSGGERQRVAVARALIHHPALVLADEPTGNLDRRTAQSVGQLLLDLHREQNTILIVVTHSAELARQFPRQLEMGDGTLQ